jgi:RNA recognition motif-containing protein
MAAAGLDMSLEDLISQGGNGGGGGGAPKGKTSRVPSYKQARRPAPYASKPMGRAQGRLGGGGGGGTSVYVGNLSWDVSWQDLKDHFKSVGPVAHADVMLEPGTTRSKGCGLVTFANARDAATAITRLHDTELKGRLIFVREDRESPAVGASMMQRGGFGQAQSLDGCKVFVGNLPRETTWMDLKDMFREAGNVMRADIAQTADGSSKGYGTVLLGSTREAAKAIQVFNGSEYGGQLLDVRPDAFA